MALTKVKLTDINPFDMKLIMEGGQAFRWQREEDGKYIGVAGERIIIVADEGELLTIETYAESDETCEEVRSFLIDYFDIDRDYKAIEKRMSQYEELRPAVTFASGSRVLQQDPWEITVSFIISANNSIRNIRNIIERMCRQYGDPIQFRGKTYYSFPKPETLADLSECELKTTRCGFRAKRIIETAKMVCAGDIDLYGLRNLSTRKARAELLRLPGVGKKVADCIMLFSMSKFDSFPIDVWIKRALEHIYFNGKEMPIRKLSEFAETKFKDMAGFIQQYLFHYTRTCWEDFKQKDYKKYSII